MLKPQDIRRYWRSFATTPILIRLVWAAAPILLLTVLSTTLLSSALPIGWLYTNKLILDWITISIGQSTINWTPLITLISLRFLLSLGKTSLNQLISHFSQLLSNQFSLHITQKILEKSIHLDLIHYESSEFYAILNRAQQSGSTYPVKTIGNLTTLMSQLVTLSGLLILLLSFNPILIVVLLLSSLPVLQLGASHSHQKFSLNRKQTLNGRISSYFQRLITHQEFAKEIRIFNLGPHFINQWRNRFELTNQELKQLSAKYLKSKVLISVLPNFGLYIAYLFVLIETVKKVVTLGSFTMYAGAFAQSQSLLEGIAQNISATYESNLFISQYFEFLDLKPQIASPRNPVTFPQPITQGVLLDNVSFQYPRSARPVLRNLTLRVFPGESIALVGGNGAGKTTLVNLLTRLYEPNSGQIMIDGVPLRALNLEQLRQNIAVLFQDFSRYHLSIQENIGFGDIGALSDRQRIEKASAEAGASEWISTLEHGYQTHLGTLFPDGQNLSGGQWQKVGLARAFMSNAQILILDEPTAAMDAIAEFEMFRKFQSLTQDKITFFISHRFSSVRLADRIVLLNNGEISEVGTHHELMELNGLYARMFKLQAEGYQSNHTNE